MKIIILGSGGSVPLPRPFCNCKNCTKARIKGIPYARTGPSMFVEDEFILFDTPEEIVLQIEREKIERIKHVFYTHWHPDHTQGLRVFEHIPSDMKPINVYIPKNAISDFKKYCEGLFYFNRCGFIKIIEIEDRVPVKIGKITVTPLDFRRKDRVRYGYLIEGDDKKVVYAPCSIFDLFLDEKYNNLDLILMEMGWFGNTEETRKKLPKDHLHQDHISFEENIELIKKIKPKRTIMLQIEGTRHLSDEANYDYLVEYVKKFKDLNISISYDGMKIEI